MKPWQEPVVWETVAADLRGYRQAGIGGILTEDTVRFAVAQALLAAGADAAAMRVEWPHPTLRGSRIDLVAGGPPPEVFIELKYPREPTEKNAAWTMALGEVLKDLYRLAVAPGEVDRLFVYAETARLRRYMASSATRYGLDLDVDEVTLTPDAASRLPTTAAVIIGSELAAHRITATRIAIHEVDSDLRLTVYQVDALGVPPTPAAALAAVDATGVWNVPSDAVESPVSDELAEGDPLSDLTSGSRDGARTEILRASRAVTARSGDSTFTMTDIIQEMQRARTGYAESTIRTMVTGHMCVNAPNNTATPYEDFERLDRGVYRPYRG